MVVELGCTCSNVESTGEGSFLIVLDELKWYCVNFILKRGNKYGLTVVLMLHIKRK